MSRNEETVALALGTLIACGIDLVDEEKLWGDGERGEGAGDWLAVEKLVGEFSATGEDVFHPKNDVNLLGPGDLGVLVMVVGS